MRIISLVPHLNTAVSAGSVDAAEFQALLRQLGSASVVHAAIMDYHPDEWP